MKLYKLLLLLLCLIALLHANAFAEDRKLSVVSTTGATTLTVTEGGAITVLVKVDDATNIAGAAFTITYDTTNLVLESVTSSFFGTFVQQIAADAGCVTVGEEYCSPIVKNSVSTGSMIAAARATQGTGTNITLFTLNLALKSGGATGTYSIGLIQSIITNTDAGYASKTTIPALVGIDGEGGYPSYTLPAVTPLSLTINAGIVDSDKDGIDDNWEIAHLPAGYSGAQLALFTADGDYDSDGYSDYQEYLNSGKKDPAGNYYDPTVANAAGGTGYRAPTTKSLLPIYQLLLLDN